MEGTNRVTPKVTGETHFFIELNNITAPQFRELTQDQRKIVKEAFENLSNTINSNKDYSDIIAKLKTSNPRPSSSFLESLWKGIQNRLGGISSEELGKLYSSSGNAIESALKSQNYHIKEKIIGQLKTGQEVSESDWNQAKIMINVDSLADQNFRDSLFPIFVEHALKDPELEAKVKEKLLGYIKKNSPDKISEMKVDDLSCNYGNFMIQFKKKDPSFEIPEIFWASPSFRIKYQKEGLELPQNPIKIKNLNNIFYQLDKKEAAKSIYAKYKDWKEQEEKGIDISNRTPIPTATLEQINDPTFIKQLGLEMRVNQGLLLKHPQYFKGILTIKDKSVLKEIKEALKLSLLGMVEVKRDSYFVTNQVEKTEYPSITTVINNNPLAVTDRELLYQILMKICENDNYEQKYITKAFVIQDGFMNKINDKKEITISVKTEKGHYDFLKHMPEFLQKDVKYMKSLVEKDIHVFYSLSDDMKNRLLNDDPQYAIKLLKKGVLLEELSKEFKGLYQLLPKMDEALLPEDFKKLVSDLANDSKNNAIFLEVFSNIPSMRSILGKEYLEKHPELIDEIISPSHVVLNPTREKELIIDLIKFKGGLSKFDRSIYGRLILPYVDDPNFLADLAKPK